MMLNFFSPPWCEQLTPFLLHRDSIPRAQLLAKFGHDWTHPRGPQADFLPKKAISAPFRASNGTFWAVFGLFQGQTVPHHIVGARQAIPRVWTCKPYMLRAVPWTPSPRGAYFEAILRRFGALSARWSPPAPKTENAR